MEYSCQCFPCAVGIVPPRTKSPTDLESQQDVVHRRNRKTSNGHSRVNAAPTLNEAVRAALSARNGHSSCGYTFGSYVRIQVDHPSHSLCVPRSDRRARCSLPRRDPRWAWRSRWSGSVGTRAPLCGRSGAVPTASRQAATEWYAPCCEPSRDWVPLNRLKWGMGDRLME